MCRTVALSDRAYLPLRGMDDGRPSVGWVPLAPHEVFHPYYPVSDGYVRAVNVTHVADVADIAVHNRSVGDFANHQAATVIPNGAFTGAQPVHRAAMPMAPGQVQQVPVNNTINTIGRLQPTAASPAGAPPSGPPPVRAAQPMQQNKPQPHRDHEEHPQTENVEPR